MASYSDFLKAFEEAIRTELSIVRQDADRAHKNKDNESMKIILSYAKGLQRACFVFSGLMESIEKKDEVNESN